MVRVLLVLDFKAEDESFAGQRMSEAKRAFQVVYGFDESGVKEATECLAKADLIYCDTSSVVKEVWPFARSGAFVYVNDEVPGLTALWKEDQKQLYKKD